MRRTMPIALASALVLTLSASGTAEDGMSLEQYGELFDSSIGPSMDAAYSAITPEADAESLEFHSAALADALATVEGITPEPCWEDLHSLTRLAVENLYTAAWVMQDSDPSTSLRTNTAEALKTSEALLMAIVVLRYEYYVEACAP